MRREKSWVLFYFSTKRTLWSMILFIIFFLKTKENLNSYFTKTLVSIQPQPPSFPSISLRHSLSLLHREALEANPSIHKPSHIIPPSCVISSFMQQCRWWALIGRWSSRESKPSSANTSWTFTGQPFS